jgi:hypothetical protein
MWTTKSRAFGPVVQESNRLQPTSIFINLGNINSSESITGGGKYGVEKLTTQIAKSNVTPLQSTLPAQNLTGALRLANPDRDQGPRNQISSWIGDLAAQAEEQTVKVEMKNGHHRKDESLTATGTHGQTETLKNLPERSRRKGLKTGVFSAHELLGTVAATWEQIERQDATWLRGLWSRTRKREMNTQHRRPVQTELEISALIETGGEEKTLCGTHLSKDRNSGTGNEIKERRHDPRQPEKISPRATATSRKISENQIYERGR